MSIGVNFKYIKISTFWNVCIHKVNNESIFIAVILTKLVIKTNTHLLLSFYFENIYRLLMGAVIDRVLLWWRCYCRNLRVSHPWLKSITNATFLCTICLHATNRVNGGSKCALLLVATPDAHFQRRFVNAMQQRAKKVQAYRERRRFARVGEAAHAKKGGDRKSGVGGCQST